MRFIKHRNKFTTESLDSEMNVPDIIWEIHDIFNEYKFKLFLVGGSVRDFLSKEEPKDFDVASDAKPNEIVHLLKDKFGVRKEKGHDFILNNRWRVNLQGEAFGVVVVYVPGEKEGIEIASFSTRHDGEIILGASIEDDVMRRDITFNALFYDLDKKEIIDLVGGAEDLENKRLRMVGDPNQRIIDDPLRIQRLFRFGPRYDAVMDDETKKAINDNKHLYREPTAERPHGVSQERIIEEFMKSFKTLSDFQKYVDYLDEFVMWKILFEGISFDKAPNYESTDSLEVCLAQLLVNESDDIFKSVMTGHWKFPSKLTNVVKLLVDLHKVNSGYSSYNETINKAMNIRMNQLRTNVHDRVLEKFISVMNLNNPLIDKILKFDPSSIKSTDVMDDLGMERDGDKLKNPRKDGANLGRELQNRKLELFKSL